jgi:hypothetical protein
MSSGDWLYFCIEMLNLFPIGNKIILGSFLSENDNIIVSYLTHPLRLKDTAHSPPPYQSYLTQPRVTHWTNSPPISLPPKDPTQISRTHASTVLVSPTER